MRNTLFHAGKEWHPVGLRDFTDYSGRCSLEWDVEDQEYWAIVLTEDEETLCVGSRSTIEAAAQDCVIFLHNEEEYRKRHPKTGSEH
jgi:hypothetical protein